MIMIEEESSCNPNRIGNRDFIRKYDNGSRHQLDQLYRTVFKVHAPLRRINNQISMKYSRSFVAASVLTS